MEEAARKRRERLQAIKSGAPIEEASTEDIVKTLAYTNPDDEEQQSTVKHQLVTESIFAGDETLERQVSFLLSEAKTLASSTRVGEGDVTLEDLAPQRATWDLKRDYEARTAALRKMYDRACAELIHERLSNEATE